MPKSPRSKPKRSAASAASSSAAASSSSQAPPKPALRRTLLIVGATQNGKSTFSNFMYQGKEYNETEIVFPIGNESTSKTKSPQSAAFRYRYLDQKRGEDGNAVIADKEIIFSVVDTPGIGDTSGVDEETNLQFLYSRLISMAERGDVLSGIIICSRFGALQNEEYTRNIKFYREMFKDVFHSNVIIVITNVDHTNPRWIRQKQMCGEPWERQIETQKQWIQSTLGLEADAMTVYLDAMPFDLPAATHASKIRHMILQHCRKTKIDIKKITFVKSLPLQAQHQSDIAKLQGMIEGISTGIKITDSQNGVIAAKINAQSSSIAELKQRIVDLKELRRQLNTDADYSLGTHKAEDGWHWFSRASAKFDVQRRHPITKLHVSQGWYELDGAIPSFHVRGTVKNTLWQSLSATLTLYTTNRIFFADKVANLKVEIRESKAKQREEEEELARYRENNATNNAVLDKFTAQIQELNNDIAELRKTTMTFQEARSFYSDPCALDRPEDQLPVREDESPQPETSFGRIRARIREYERLAHYLPR